MEECMSQARLNSMCGYLFYEHDLVSQAECHFYTHAQTWQMSSRHVFHIRKTEPLANTIQGLEMHRLPLPFTPGTHGPQQRNVAARAADQECTDPVPSLARSNQAKVDETLNLSEFQYASP